MVLSERDSGNEGFNAGPLQWFCIMHAQVAHVAEHMHTWRTIEIGFADLILRLSVSLRRPYCSKGHQAVDESLIVLHHPHDQAAQ